MTRGEVRWLTSLTGGRRPALIVTRAAAVERLNRVVIVPTTTRVRAIPTEVPLTREDGMPQDCVLSIDNLQLADRRRLGPLITRLSDARMVEVCERLRFSLSC